MIRKIPLKWRNPFFPVASGSEPFVLKFPFLKNYFLTSPLPNFQPLAPRSKPFRFQFSTKKRARATQRSATRTREVFFVSLLVLLEYYLALLDHLANVDQGVAHASQGCVDADACQLGDFLETHIGIVPQNNDFALFGRKHIY